MNKDDARNGADLPPRRDAQAPPLYTARQPPLMQPRETTAFAERTAVAFGVRDLGHEWVTLFQTIGAMSGGYSRSMKLHIPDTVLLSPSGLPSMWYTTSASSHIKPRNLMRVTPRSILDAFSSSSSTSPAPHDIAAVQRVGFRVETLTLRQLRGVCTKMEQPRIVERRQEWENDMSDDDDSEGGHDARTYEQLTPFCLQRFIPRDRGVTFLVLWRCKHRSAGVPVHDSVTHKQYARSFYKRPLPLLTSDILSKCDLFLYERSRDATNSQGCVFRERDDDDDERDATEQSSHDVLTHLDLESATLFDDALARYGFAEDVIVPQLYYMKLVASEILNRLNRGLQARQAAGLLCEFFVGAHDKRVYYSGLCGTHWEHCEPSWETLADVDATSRAVTSDHDLAALQRFSELNPRFPSVQSPYVSEQQWRYQSPLLPPDVSPRYIGEQVPKSYRDGRFHALLTPAQADSGNRLNLSPRPPAARIQYPLSKQFAKLERLSGSRAPLSPRRAAVSNR